jgi:hypothetical protein
LRINAAAGGSMIPLLLNDICKKNQDNPARHNDFSPLNHFDKLKGSLLLIYGTGHDKFYCG